MIITLPIPPSVNAMYRRSRGSYGMYKSQEAKEWIKECMYLLRGKQRFPAEVRVTIHFYFNRDRDIDNSLKALLDVLQEGIIIRNDSLVTEMHVYKHSDKKNPRVELELDNS